MVLREAVSPLPPVFTPFAYLILLPFYDFIGTMESCACALPDIVRLSHELATFLRNIFPW
jgi:hypothetical protein